MLKSIVTVLLAFGCAFSFAACNDYDDHLHPTSETEETTVCFLSLQEAFESGDISRDDLIEMSNLLNENASLPTDLADQEILENVKTAYSELNAVAVENIALEYYGEYNGNYAVIIFDKNDNFATVITEVKIADVTFYYPVSGIEIVICKTDGDEQNNSTTSNNGQFYSLDEAYALKKLSKEQLSNIADQYNTNETQIINNQLNQEIQRKIKNCYLFALTKIAPSATIDDVVIVNYYGTYDECVVVEVTDSIIQYDLIFETKDIDGVTFYNYCARKLSVWILGDLYEDKN